MVTRADSTRLALLIAHYEATREFSDEGAITVLRWYEAFCSSKGGNTLEPLDLSNITLSRLPDLIRIPLSLGIPYIKLADNPALMDVSTLHDLPLMTKMRTLEYALSRTGATPMAQLINEIMETLLGPKTTIKVSLAGLKAVPVYLQLLPDLEALWLTEAGEIAALPNLSHLTRLSKLDICDLRSSCHLEGLGNLSSLKHLRVSYAVSDPGRPSLYWITNTQTLEKLYLQSLLIDDVSALQNLPNLLELRLFNCPNIRLLPNLEKFLALQKLSVKLLDGLISVSINGTNSLLEEIEIGASRLQMIDGLHLLKGLKKFKSYGASGLQSLEGLKESIYGLRELNVGTTDMDFIRFLKDIRSKRLLRGKLQLLLENPGHAHARSIGLFKHDFQEDQHIRIQLLRQKIVALGDSPDGGERVAMRCQETTGIDTLTTPASLAAIKAVDRV